MPSEPIVPNHQESAKPLFNGAIVNVIGVLGTVLALPHVLGHIPLQNLLKNELHVDRAANAAFFFWMTFVWYFKPFFGIVTDAFPLFGSRRKSYGNGVGDSAPMASCNVTSHLVLQVFWVAQSRQRLEPDLDPIDRTAQVRLVAQLAMLA